MASPIISIPNISTAKPTMTVPTSRRLLFFDIIIMPTPIMAITGEKDAGLSRLTNTLLLSMPVKLKTQAVTVVPIFEPRTTPMLCLSVIIPELTRPTSITVTADEDCITAVVTSPSRMPLHLLEVSF